MINKRLRIIRIILSALLFCGMLFFLLNIIGYYQSGNSEKVTTFTEPKTIYGTEKCYRIKDMIYVINTSTGIVHIFDINGDFEKGFQLPNNGGDIWIGIDDSLYAYCVRTKLLVEISGAETMSQTNIYYNNPSLFYDSHNISNKTLLMLKKNTIILKENDYETKINLKVKNSVLSVPVCIILYAICLFAFLFTTGLFKKHDFFSGLGWFETTEKVE